MIVLLLVLNLSLVYASETNNSCAVYFTATFCNNCKVTDPLALGQWPRVYPHLVIIEYSFDSWGDENYNLLTQYSNVYGGEASVPRLFVNNTVFAGRLEVFNGEEQIKRGSRECALLNGNSSFDELDLNALEGAPLKVWSKGRLLVRTGEGTVSSDILRKALLSENITDALENLTLSGIKIESVTPEPAPIAYGEIVFENAVKIEDSWLLEFNESMFVPMNASGGDTIKTDVITLLDWPFIGKIEIDTENNPLVITTLLIGLADGFNPCAFFILTFLLSILMMARSRKKILIVGGVFVFISGLIYLLSMLALYIFSGFILDAGKFSYLVIIAAVIAVIAGVINIKDYFFFKKGVSLTLPTSTKETIPEKAKKLMSIDSLPVLIAATVVFASTVNIYEMICTAGFPLIYITVLQEGAFPFFDAFLYLLLYNMIYVLPLACIVLLFATKMGGKSFDVEKVKALKLVSGFMILFLGGALFYSLKEPKILMNPANAFSLIILAVIVSGVVIFAKKKLAKSHKA